MLPEFVAAFDLRVGNLCKHGRFLAKRFETCDVECAQFVAIVEQCCQLRCQFRVQATVRLPKCGDVA